MTVPASADPFELAPAPDPYVKADYVCAANYFPSSQSWEVSWGGKISGGLKWSSISFDGITYIDPGKAGKTPAGELAAIHAYDAEHGGTKLNTAYHWWYPSFDMVTNEAKVVIGFKDGDVILGQTKVGNDNCPSVRWIHYSPAGDILESAPPATYPTPGDPLPVKPIIRSDSDSSPFGSLGSLSMLFGS